MPNIDARREIALNVYTFCKEEAARQCYKFPVSQPRARASAMTRIPAGNLFLSLSLSLSHTHTHTHTHTQTAKMWVQMPHSHPAQWPALFVKYTMVSANLFLMKMFTYETDTR